MNVQIFSAILVIGIGIYFAVFNKNSQTDDYDDFNDDLTPETAKWVNNEEIQIFRKYLRYKTVSLEGNFGNFFFQFIDQFKYSLCDSQKVWLKCVFKIL